MRKLVLGFTTLLMACAPAAPPKARPTANVADTMNEPVTLDAGQTQVLIAALTAAGVPADAMGGYALTDLKCESQTDAAGKLGCRFSYGDHDGKLLMEDGATSPAHLLIGVLDDLGADSIVEWGVSDPTWSLSAVACSATSCTATIDDDVEFANASAPARDINPTLDPADKGAITGLLSQLIKENEGDDFEDDLDATETYCKLSKKGALLKCHVDYTADRWNGTLDARFQVTGGKVDKLLRALFGGSF